MEQLLIIRETLISFFKRYETYLLPVLRFLLGMFLYHKIHTIGYIQPDLAAAALPPSFFPLATLMLGLAFALLPLSLSYFLMIVDIALQHSANLEIAAVVFLFLLCILLFYARLAPKESFWILLTILAFYFKLPYLVPLLAGLYCSLTVIIPVTIGTLIYTFIPVLQGMMLTSKSAGLNLTEMPASIAGLYNALLTSFSVTSGWLFTAFIFAMVIIVVHVVSRLSIDYAKEIALGLGCVMNIFGFIMAVLIASEQVNIFVVLLLTLVCGFIAECVRWFDTVLDYQRAESVQFEDEHNFYYVRVIPKVTMSKRKRVVRRIRPQTENED